MVKNINKNIMLLSCKSKDAAIEDSEVISDLKDTLSANSDRCVGMAANMIGVLKKIIIVNIGSINMIMVNPEILKKSGEYETEEGCLSLEGVRKVKRYKNIEVKFQDEKFVKRVRNFSGFTAQIIQHEIDHCNGIII